MADAHPESQTAGRPRASAAPAAPGDGADTSEWHVARGEVVDTDAVPRWLRTGYRYFPYAAAESGRDWVLRVNYCFPEHPLMTLFIDGRVVAEATASANDSRPLLASLSTLPMNGERATHCAVMAGESARRVVESVSAFLVHRSEWDDPCDLCEFAERNPFERNASDPVSAPSVDAEGGP